MWQKLKAWASKLKEDIYTLYLASKDPRMPFMAKIIVVLTVAYAFSPIDLIPDFIPILGYLDDLLILPGGIWLSIKLIPKPIVQEYRKLAKTRLIRKKPNYTVAALIVLLWILLAFWTYKTLFSRIGV